MSSLKAQIKKVLLLIVVVALIAGFSVLSFPYDTSAINLSDGFHKESSVTTGGIAIIQSNKPGKSIEFSQSFRQSLWWL